MMLKLWFSYAECLAYMGEYITWVLIKLTDKVCEVQFAKRK